MYRQLLRPVSAMVLALAAGGPSATAATTIRAPRAVDPARVGQAQNHLRSLQAQLGLTGAADFQVRHAFLNPQGSTIVHFQQTHQGVPVWNAEAIVHVSADGAVTRVVNGLLPGVQLTGGPTLTAAQASALALRDLAPKGRMELAPLVTEVVFPSRATGGFATRMDPVTHRVTLDRTMSILAKAPAAPFVWAYEVKTSLRNAQDGMKQVSYIIDASTGAILRKANDLRAGSATPNGNSVYNGQVVLAATQAADTTWSLVDPVRGAASSSPNMITNTTGLATAYDFIQNQGGGWLADLPATYAGNATNTWGDGTVYADTVLAYDAFGDFWWAGAETASGQTDAVDAQYGMTQAWDLFQNVFGFNGMDNQGTTISAVVHTWPPQFGNFVAMPYTSHNAFGPPYNYMILGDGDGVTRGPQTELDIVGHEMAHIFSQAVPNFSYQGESAALEEATSDILGKMTQAYAQGMPGAGPTIPDFPAGSAAALQKIWSFGANADMGSPERYFYKPSLDGISPDGWYDGMASMLPWYSSGPINRMFFFLVNGTSANPADPNYSVYLPVATTGLGNDAAARIWFAAVTENMTPTTDLFGAQAAADLAASTLFGAGSAQELQVLNAFAAVNIGDAPGQPKRVKVTFPVLNAPASLIGQGSTYWTGTFTPYQFFPPHTNVKVQIDVQNATNPAVTWSYAPAMDGLRGGEINADGTWTTPFSASPETAEPYMLVATSVQDPSQFALGSMFVINIDADDDTVTDALDLGQIAACWGLGYNANPYPTTMLWDPNESTGDWDIAMFQQVLTNAWPVN